MAKTSKDVSPSTMTQMQELGSAWVFKRAIQDNPSPPWRTWEDLKRDSDTYNELVRIWDKVGGVAWDDTVDNEWLQNFFEQQKALLLKIQKPEFTEFVRSEGYQLPKSPGGSRPTGETFMEWVSNWIGSEYSIGNKDNWNPADIWLIRNEQRHKDEIKASTGTGLVKKKGTIIAQLKQLNSIFRRLFRDREIVGISLKKIGKGDTATFKEINVTGAYFKTIEASTMQLTGVRCYLGTKRINMKKNKKTGKMEIDERAEERSIRKGLGTTGFPTIETQDSVLTIKDTENNLTYTVQIKNTSTDKMDNLKFEPTEKGKSSARMGKATREFVFDLMRSYGILGKFPKTHQQYPKTKAAFNNTKMNAVGRQIKSIQSKGSTLGVTVDWGGIRFPGVMGPINIKETMGRKNEAWTANSKLQQISFLNAILSLPATGERSVDHFCTDLIYLAAKQGRKGGYYGTGYAPFGKIY